MLVTIHSSLGPVLADWIGAAAGPTSGTRPWLSADALKNGPSSPARSSELLSQEFIAAPQPVPVMVPQPAAAPATTISGYSSAASLYSGCMPYGAAYTTAPAQVGWHACCHPASTPAHLRMLIASHMPC